MRIRATELLGEGRWGLERARSIADEIRGDPREVRALIKSVFSEDAESRKRASDVAHRITDRSPQTLWAYADELAGLLAELAPEESRTKWHLGLVVARVAHTREQRLRAARLMEMLVEDESNAARCSAVEGMGLLASEEASLRGVAEEMMERALREGTLAMKARARHSKRRLERIRKVSGNLG
jgi:hypothetical protein